MGIRLWLRQPLREKLSLRLRTYAGLALVSTNSYDIFDSPNEGIGRCFMAKGPKVSHPEYVDFNSDEDDLLGDDELLVDNYSDEYYD